MENIIKAYSKKYKTKYLMIKNAGVMVTLDLSLFLNKVFEKL